MFRKIVAVEDPLINDEARKALYDFAQQVIIYNDSPVSEDELICRIGDADAVLVTFKTQIGRKAIEASPQLKYIGMCCTLFESCCNVDLQAAREAGIVVTGVRDYGDEGVVEYAISEVVRYLHGFGERQWRDKKYELGEMKVGIVGLGKTGRMTADAFRLFGSEVYYYSRSRKPEAEEEGIGYLPLDDLLATCDIIMTTLPRNTLLLKEREFGIIGNGKILINTSIGPTFDVEAMKRWLVDNPDSSYFCDGTGMGTLRDELAPYRNVFYTPAVAGMSVQSTGRLSRKVLENIRQYMDENN